MNRESAEIIAIQGLAFLAADDDLMGAFLDLSGLDPAELRARLSEPAFLVAVLDFILAEDARVLAFCEAAELKPNMPGEARRAIPGGEDIEWT